MYGPLQYIVCSILFTISGKTCTTSLIHNAFNLLGTRNACETNIDKAKVIFLCTFN